MKTDIKIQKGDIRKFPTKKLDGMVNYSSLIQFKSKAKSEHYSIKYVIEGKESYNIDGALRHVQSDQFLIIRPNQEVETEINSSVEVRGICLYIPPKIFESSLAKLTNCKSLFPDFPIDSNHTGIHHFINGLSSRKNISDSDAVISKFTDHFAHFITKTNISLKSIGAGKEDTQLDLWNKIEKSRQYIHSNIQSTLRLNEIACEAHLSPFHFQRTFKSFYNITPANYILKLRMQMALKLLRQNKLPLKTIAHRCGYQDIKYFKMCLKKNGLLHF